MINIKLNPKFDFGMTVKKYGTIEISFMQVNQSIADEMVNFFRDNGVKAYITKDYRIIADCSHFDPNDIAAPLSQELHDRGFTTNCTWES